MKTSNLPSVEALHLYDLVLPTAILALIFLSVIPLGSSTVWNESIVISVILILSGIVCLRKKSFSSENGIKQLAVPLILLAVYSLIQSVLSVLTAGTEYPAASALPISFDPVSAAWSAVKLFSFACFLVLCSILFQGRERMLTWGLILTGNFYSVFGILRFIIQPEYPEILGRIISPFLESGVGFGTFFNQNHFAYLMLMTLGLNVGLVKYTSLSWGIRLLLIVASIVNISAIILTGSRGGIVSSFVVIAVLLFLPLIFDAAKSNRNSTKEKQSKLVIGLKKIAVLAIFFTSFVIGIVLIGQDRVVERFENIPRQLEYAGKSDAFIRTEVWQAIIAMIKDYPLFGVGLGSFQYTVSKYIDISGKIVPKQAHNDYLEFASGVGIAGVFIGGLFLFRFILLTKKHLGELQSRFSRGARLGAICAISGVAVHSFFDFGLQIIANLLFFGALIFLAVHRSEKDKTPVQSTSDKSPSKLIPALPVAFFLITVLSLFYGMAEYFRVTAQYAGNTDFLNSRVFIIPFDPNYHSTRGSLLSILQDYGTAAEEFEKAITYRPRDYSLWLSLANLDYRLGSNSKAEIEFNKALQLAPLYAKPHYDYGKFLLAQKRIEGLSEIRYAARRDPEYFQELLDLTWSEKGGNIKDVVEFLKPMDENEIPLIVDFLIRKENYEALGELACTKIDIAQSIRDDIVTKLIESKRFRIAHKIDTNNCDAATVADYQSLEFNSSSIRKGQGFGWRLSSGLDSTRISLDAGKDQGANSSLRFDFNGNNSSDLLLSNSLPAEANQNYELSFFYKTQKIITGGSLLVKVILKQPGSDIIAGEIPLSTQGSDWINPSLKFKTNPSTESVEIALFRQSCDRSLCPIFGNLWLDNFNLKRLP